MGFNRDKEPLLSPKELVDLIKESQRRILNLERLLDVVMKNTEDVKVGSVGIYERDRNLPEFQHSYPLTIAVKQIIDHLGMVSSDYVPPIPSKLIVEKKAK